MTALDKTRALQSMAFGTQGGEYLRDLFFVAGHFIDPQSIDPDDPRDFLPNEQARIEHNLIRRLMRACGISLEFHPMRLPDANAPEPNLIDEINEGGPTG